MERYRMVRMKEDKDYEILIKALRKQFLNEE